LDSTTPTDSVPTARGRGRPVTISRELRREQILKVAESLFKQAGYATTSMADIARVCETSKRTLYELFPAKEDLFRALVADVESFPDTAHEIDDTADAQEVLEATLAAIAHYVLSERHVTVSRLVIAESNLFPEIRQHYYEQGINRSKQWLESRIAALVERKRIAPVNVDRTADMLFGAVIGTHLITAISYRETPDMAEVAHKAREAVARLVDPL
jgi:AcrR family transcriptional regulator